MRSPGSRVTPWPLRVTITPSRTALRSPLVCSLAEAVHGIVVPGLWPAWLGLFPVAVIFFTRWLLAEN